MKNKKVIIIGVIICAIVLVSILGTYAYFLASLGETRNEVVKAQAGTMELTFSDNDILGNIGRTLNFGDTVEKELKIENNGTLDAYAKISWDDLTNTFLDGSLTYTLEYKTSETGTYQPLKIKSNKVPVSNTASKQLIVDRLKIPSGSTYIYKITITYNNLDVDQTQDLNATFRTKFTLDEGSEPSIDSDTVIASLKLKVNPNQSETVPNFETVATTDETSDGLYSLEDDYGTSYYYRGAVENNYVKFGKNKDRQDMYWRIIRFNGDGSARLIYDGTQAFANGTADDSRYALTNVAWNANYNDAKYVGWMFGGADGAESTSKEEAQRNETDSDIKEAVDAWYVDNIQGTGFSKYLTDAVFCNDRSTPGEDLTGWTGDTGLGFGTNYTGYGAITRTGTWKTDSIRPDFTCKNINDAFTLKDNMSLEVTRTKNKEVVGNKALTYPIGLISADEILAAGSGKYRTANSNYYLYKSSNTYSWSLSPYDSDNHNASVFVFGVGYLNDLNVKNTNGTVSPVINISADYVLQLQGEGTRLRPYYLEIE